MEPGAMKDNGQESFSQKADPGSILETCLTPEQGSQEVRPLECNTFTYQWLLHLLFLQQWLLCSYFVLAPPLYTWQNVEAQGDLGAHLLKTCKALIGLTPLVISWSKALPTFPQTPVKFWVRNIFCVKPLESYGLPINTDSISVLQQIHWCYFILFLSISKPAYVTFLAILWASGTYFQLTSFLLSLRIDFYCLQQKPWLIH